MDSRWLFILLAVLMSLLKLWLVSGQILQALGTYLFDDMLFISHARSLLAGDWLGPYNERTLIKGMFYPMWIAMMSSVGAPLLLAQHTLYMAACAAFVFAIRPLISATGPLLILYLVLLFNPMSFTEEVSTRVLRDGIYPALTILVLSSAIGFLARVNASMRAQLFWAIAFGLSLSMFSLTREEGIWLLPGITLVMALSAWRIWTAGLGWRRLSLCLLPGLIWIMAMGGVATINMKYYGIFETIDLKAPGFRAAYGSLVRIKSQQSHPTIPVPEEVRERAYKVSPAFAELQPILEGERGAGWKGRGWRFEGRFSHWDWGGESFDIHRGPFQWALRDAALRAGHYASAKDAEDYYWRIAREVNGACQQKILDCGPEKASLMPRWQAEYSWPLISTFLRAVAYFVQFEDFKAAPHLSRGPQSVLDMMADLTHEKVFLSARGQLNLRGWAFIPGESIGLSVVRANGEAAPAVIRRGHSPHVYQRFLDRGRDIPEAREARFELTTPCMSGCYLQFSVAGRPVERAPLYAGMRSSFSGQVYFGVDAAGSELAGPSAFRARTMQLRLDILKYVGMAYQFIVPVLTGLALIAYVLLTLRVFRQRSLMTPWLILTALLGSVVARVLIVSVLDLLSFPAIRTLYLASAYPVMLIFIVVMLAMARSIIRKP